MKRLLIILSFLVTLLLVACGPGNTEPEPTAEAPADAVLELAPTKSDAEADGDVMPRPTITPTTAAGGEIGSYPVRPTATPAPLSYPQPEIIPTVNPYPPEGETAWVIIPAGIQCADSLEYENEAEAVKSLTDAGILTYNVRTVELPVAAVCDGPTSLQYAVEIDAQNLRSAQELGWTEVPVSEIPAFVMTPAGVQCEEPIYNSEADARATLEAAGINTFSSRTVEMMVTTSCGSPTSTHYVVEIRVNDVPAAEQLGWQAVTPADIGF